MTAEASADAKDEKTASADVFTEKQLKTIKDLKDEAAGYRIKNKELSYEFDTYKVNSESQLKKFEDEKTSIVNDRAEKLSNYQKRLINSELKSELISAGVKDTDMIKLVDTANIKINDDGEIDMEVVKNLVEKLKESKPFLFGEDKKFSTSSGTHVKKSSEQKKENVADLDDAAYAAREKAFLRTPQ